MVISERPNTRASLVRMRGGRKEQGWSDQKSRGGVARGCLLPRDFFLEFSSKKCRVLCIYIAKKYFWLYLLIFPVGLGLHV